MVAEKQIASARANEVAMAAIRADPQILEEHLAIEATVNASHANVVEVSFMVNEGIVLGHKIYERGI